MYEVTTIKNDGTEETIYYEHWHESVLSYLWFCVVFFLVSGIGLLIFPFVAVYLLFDKKQIGARGTKKKLFKFPNKHGVA